MVGSARHFFARGHTARGAYSLYDSAFAGLRRIYLLGGDSGVGKAALLKQIADEMITQGQRVELFHSPLRPEELEALIITELKVGIAGEDQGLDDRSGTELVRIDLGPAMDLTQLSAKSKQEIAALHRQMLGAYTDAFESFATALRIHDEWERIYIGQMDFRKADQVGDELIGSLFEEQVRQKRATVRHLFFGAATPQGAIDHIPTLSDGLARRILIKGRPGSGKSTLLKRLVGAAEERGFDVEVYHCGFDPNSLDMLIFPELDVAIFDSTAPHEYFPSRSSDEVLDMYERTMQPGTDERNASELKEIQQRYAHKMQEAIAYLGVAQQLAARVEAQYASVTDFDLVEQVGGALQSELVRLATSGSDRRRV